MQPVALLAFMALFTALVLLPLLPAWREWRRPTDRSALPVLRAYTSDIDFFADAFRRQVLIEGATRHVLSDSLFDYVRGPVDQLQWHAARRPLISMIALSLRRAVRCQAPLFVQADMDVTCGSRFNAILATGAIRLGPSCEIRQWAHADGSLTLGSNGAGVRRLSSGVQVVLGPGCVFERVSAPVIRFGGIGTPDACHPDAGLPLVPLDTLSPLAPLLPLVSAPATPSLTRHHAAYADLPNARRRSASLYRIEGDCLLLPGQIYTGSLVVTGRLTVGAGTKVVGDIKARSGICLQAGAAVDGAVVCEASIEVGVGAFIRGPLVACDTVALAPGSCTGTAADGTTLSAAAVVAYPGATVHGAVWAHDAGLVMPE